MTLSHTNNPPRLNKDWRRYLEEREYCFDALPARVTSQPWPCSPSAKTKNLLSICFCLSTRAASSQPDNSHSCIWEHSTQLKIPYTGASSLIETTTTHQSNMHSVLLWPDESVSTAQQLLLALCFLYPSGTTRLQDSGTTTKV